MSLKAQKIHIGKFIICCLTEHVFADQTFKKRVFIRMIDIRNAE